jgi:hypothetical protein
MMARQREPARPVRRCRRECQRVHHFEIGQRQRAGLVEDDVVGFRQPLDRIAGIEQHAGLEHRARGHRLHRRNRKPDAQGQVMISTATPVTIASCQDAPATTQPKMVMSAVACTTGA